MSEIIAALTVNGQVVEVWLNQENYYDILLSKNNVTLLLHSHVHNNSLNAEISVIQENEPRLLQGWRLIIEQE